MCAIFFMCLNFISIFVRIKVLFIYCFSYIYLFLYILVEIDLNTNSLMYYESTEVIPKSKQQFCQAKKQLYSCIYKLKSLQSTV